MVPEIKEFDLSDNPWRISWLGEVLFPSTGYDEPRILVHLSELAPGHENPLSQKSLLKGGGHQTVRVKIGLISLLQVGSVWKKGVLQVGRTAAAQSDFKVTHGGFNLVQFGGTLDL